MSDTHPLSLVSHPYADVLNTARAVMRELATDDYTGNEVLRAATCLRHQLESHVNQPIDTERLTSIVKNIEIKLSDADMADASLTLALETMRYLLEHENEIRPPQPLKPSPALPETLPEALPETDMKPALFPEPAAVIAPPHKARAPKPRQPRVGEAAAR